ncbi:hypothetical protein Sp245p_32070 (plasmid) [Azospirillum baldaniorum]|uniref:Uncharacterized protein n=1 Tax=Azospirillum baldaniorum TaxID=1064539 RepID=A0A9P1NS05_9PROT|nr:hypothetical protein Sp245p_32070 [Azospirillum baldaniorum]CCD03546.1 protein of unknown function [Azospirillum baldaniorum]
MKREKHHRIRAHRKALETHSLPRIPPPPAEICAYLSQPGAKERALKNRGTVSAAHFCHGTHPCRPRYWFPVFDAIPLRRKKSTVFVANSPAATRRHVIEERMET